MNSSIKVFEVNGISIRIHITFPLILILAAMQFGLFTGQGISGAVFGVVVTLLLFTIVVLHELGHSLVAQRYGVNVKQIVLLPIGGVAQLERIPEEPKQELLIAIAGPMVNFILAILMIITGAFLGLGVALENPFSILSSLGILSLSSIFSYLFVSNLLLGLFNLIPAFPMDGGRVLRALLATKVDYARSTSIAVAVGQAIAWLLGLWGLFGGGFTFVLIAIFIYIGAGQEGRSVQVRNVLQNYIVEQAYSRQARTLTPQSTLREAIELTLSTSQADFAVTLGDCLVGFLTQNRLIESLKRYRPEIPVSEVMLTDVPAVTPTEKMSIVQKHLTERELEALPVVVKDRVLGLITRQDIVELLRLISTQPDMITARS
jgi:stage IV sporulation protein FB